MIAADKPKISEVEPNDVNSAMAYYRRCVAAGILTKERTHSLMMLQDDPDALIAAIAQEKRSAASGRDGAGDGLSQLESDMASLEAALAQADADVGRSDQVAQGYNPYRDHGKFAPGPHADRKTAKVERASAMAAQAQQHVEAAVSRHGQAVTAHRAAVQEAGQALKAARAAGAKAKESPTAGNIAAWQAATNHARRAQANAAKHGESVAKHEALVERANTTHAIANAKLHEASRAAAQQAPSGPRSIQVNPRGVGFERVAGEDETGAVLHTPAPEFHFAQQMGRISGSGDHPGIEPVVRVAPKPELGIDRPHYGPFQVIQPKLPTSAEEIRAKQAADRAHVDRQRALQDAKVAEMRARGIEGIPGVAAVSLPPLPGKKR